MSTRARVDSKVVNKIIHGDYGPWEMIACLTVCGFLKFVADHSIADIMQKRVYGLYDNTGSGLQNVPRLN
jgi:predicted Co/Zn/Cd cation transporter (cation efflux family)